MRNIETELLEAENIKFLPYIGENYQEASHRILILGESHYGSQALNSYRMWTKDLVQKEYLQDIAKGHKNPWIKCFRNTAEILTGKGYNNSDYLWKDLAFYNFFQESVGDSGFRDKKYITQELIEKSRKALHDVLDILRPDIVVVWGWGKLMTTWLPVAKTKLNTKPYIFTLNGYPPVPFWCMHHPSCGICKNTHKELWQDVQKFLKWK